MYIYIYTYIHTNLYHISYQHSEAKAPLDPGGLRPRRPVGLRPRHRQRITIVMMMIMIMISTCGLHY